MTTDHTVIDDTLNYCLQDKWSFWLRCYPRSLQAKLGFCTRLHVMPFN